MLAALRRLLANPGEDREDPGHTRAHAVQLATAALLLEIRRADHNVTHTENRTIADILERHFDLAPHERAALVDDADRRVEASTSLSDFTQVINRALEAEQKAGVIEQLWRVACADQYVDKYEEHLIRRIADLLYVPHRVFVRARHQAQQQAGRPFTEAD